MRNEFRIEVEPFKPAKGANIYTPELTPFGLRGFLVVLALCEPSLSILEQDWVDLRSPEGNRKP